MLMVSSGVPHCLKAGDKVNFHDPRRWWTKVWHWFTKKPRKPVTVVRVVNEYVFITDEEAL